MWQVLFVTEGVGTKYRNKGINSISCFIDTTLSTNILYKVPPSINPYLLLNPVIGPPPGPTHQREREREAGVGGDTHLMSTVSR